MRSDFSRPKPKLPARGFVWRCAVRRAEQVLKKLEAAPDAVETLPLFAAQIEDDEPAEPAAAHPALDLLETIDPDGLTPREALDLIYRLKHQV